MNLIDWSGNNLLAVALNREVYLWNAVGAEISELMSMDEDSEPDSPLDEYITSTAWIQDSGPIIAVGNSKNVVELWDVQAKTRVRSMKSHTGRVGCLSWNQHVLSSGSRSGEIHHHDVRVREHHVGSYKIHSQEVSVYSSIIRDGRQVTGFEPNQFLCNILWYSPQVDI